MSACPGLDALERGGPELDAHLATCTTCHSIRELLRASTTPGSEDCARAELLIAAGAGSPLGALDAAFLPAHLARCPACREAALEPPLVDELGWPEVAPDNYQLGAEIGRGGMGRVVSARDRRIGRAVAVKEMLAPDPLARARFEREARITAHLQHPGIVSIYEVGRWPDGRLFYAMPILPGRTLREAISSASGPTQRLHLIPAVIDAAEAVAYAHSRRIIHRDLTPSNILLGAFGETIVIDWGVAKHLDGEDAAGETRSGNGPPITSVSAGLTAGGAVVGTPAYIAPEQADGGAVDERADVYALGAIFHHVLTGRAPYQGLDTARILERLRARQPPDTPADRSIPRDLLSVAARAMHPDPDRRYGSAAALADELRRHQSGEPLQAHAYSPRERLARWLSRRVAILVATTAAVLAVAAVALILGARVRAERNLAEETTASLLQEQGRQELLEGLPSRALAYLVSAYRRGDRSAALRFLLRRATRSLEAFRPLFQGPVYPTDLAMSPDGSTVAIANGDSISLWPVNPPAGTTSPLRRPIRVLRDGSELGRVEFSADGTQLLSWAWPSGAAVHRPDRRPAAATIWNARTGAVVQRFTTGPQVVDARWNQDRSRLLTTSEGATPIAVWDTRTGARLPGPPSARRAAWLGADALAAIDDRGSVTITDARTGRTAPPVHTGEGPVELFDASPAGTRLLLAGGNRTPALWDPRARAPLARLAVATPVAHLSFSPAGERILVVDGSFHMRLFASEDGAPVADLGKALTFRWSADGTQVATTHGDQIVRIWLAGRGALLAVHEGADVAESGGGYLMRLGFSADGSRLATASQMGFVSACDLHADALAAARPGLRGRELLGFLDGRDLLFRDPAGQLRLWSAQGPDRPFAGSWDQDRLLALDPDRHLALLRSEQQPGRLRARPTDGGGPLWDLEVGAPIRTAGVSSDGTRVLVQADDGEASLWDATAGRRLATVAAAGAGAINGHAFSPDGRILATRGFLLQLRSTADGRLLYQGDAGYYRGALAFSADSSRLAQLNLGGTVSVLDARSGRRLGGFEDPTALQALFGPGGADLVTTIGRAGASVWDWRSGRLLARLHSAAEVAVSPAHLGDAADPVARMAAYDRRGERLAVLQPGGGLFLWATDLEPRSPDEVAAIPAAHLAPWKVPRLEGGRLVARARVFAGAAPPAARPRNLDLEEGLPGRPPPGWMAPDPDRGYRTAVSEVDPRSGRRCALLEGSPWGASFGQLVRSNDQPGLRGTMFGYLMQAVDATTYRGRTVRLRVAARQAGAAPSTGRMKRVPGAFVWLRTDLRGEQSAFFDDSTDRPVTAAAWQDYQLLAEIPADAQVLSFGLAIFGDGQAWLDDVHLDVVER